MSDREDRKKGLRLGKIKYINALPFYYGLVVDDISSARVLEHSPTHINHAMRQRKIDVAPISSLEYLHRQEDYLILPNLAIGAHDFSGSVLLISQERLEGLQGATIAVSRESLSSAVLLRILLRFRYKFENQFVDTMSKPENVLKRYPAVLVIGDEALLYEPHGFVYKYDLSELWWDWTKRPFCFALWAVRREFAQEAPEAVDLFYRRLLDNLSRNLCDLESLIRNTLQTGFLDPAFPKVFGYLFNLKYGLDSSMREGLLLYYRLAHRLGLAPGPKPLEYFEAESKIAVG